MICVGGLQAEERQQGVKTTHFCWGLGVLQQLLGTVVQHLRLPPRLHGGLAVAWMKAANLLTANGSWPFPPSLPPGIASPSPISASCMYAATGMPAHLHQRTLSGLDVLCSLHRLHQVQLGCPS